MNKKKVTAGEWKQHPNMPQCVIFIDADGDMTNLLTQNAEGYYCFESEADAQLVSASKELLVVLKALIVEGDSYCERKDATMKWLPIAKAAVNKAEGVQP